MARSKESMVLVLDVGPHMAEHLVHLRRALFLMAEGKIMNLPAHEVALVLYGTTETNNEVNREMAEAGEHGLYSHVNVLQPLMCPGMDTLRLMDGLICGAGTSDHVDALLVGLDLLKKATEARPLLKGARAKRRVVLLGSLDTQVEAIDPDSQASLIQQLVAMDTSLEVLCVGGGAPARSPEAAARRDTNLAGLHDLLAHVSGGYRELPSPADMVAIWPLASVSPTGNKFQLRMGEQCAIEVQVFKKTDRKRLPALRMHNATAAADMTGVVRSETQYNDPADPDTALPPELMVRAFRYGQQLVPINDASTVELLNYFPGKGLDLIGFTARSNVPRWHFSSECWVALACQAGKPSEHAVALSALVQALEQDNKVAVLRYGRTERSEAVLMAGLPLPAPPGSMQTLDGLLLVRLPFKNDLRQLAFRAFGADPPSSSSRDASSSRLHLHPTAKQGEAMRQLVRSMRLAPVEAAAAAGEEQLVSEDTYSPMMQRFYWFVGQRALDPNCPVPDPQDDVLAKAVLDQPPLESLPPAARDVLQALPELFPTTAPPPKAGATQAAGDGGDGGGGGGSGGGAGTSAAAAAAAAALARAAAAQGGGGAAAPDVVDMTSD